MRGSPLPIVVLLVDMRAHSPFHSLAPKHLAVIFAPFAFYCHPDIAQRAINFFSQTLKAWGSAIFRYDSFGFVLYNSEGYPFITNSLGQF